MSFIAQDFNNLNIITVLKGRTQAVIRDHFLKYDRAVRCPRQNHYYGYV
ncbi:IS1167, transposase [Streptococcus pneumoniae]|nr:IS1167, transposase [Streptococcus pneumoniae]